MEQLAHFLAFATGVIWLTAGVLLTASVRASRSRSDLILGLAFVVGSIQIGITTGALAGHGAFPVEALLIMFALLWVSSGDEADSLQRGDLKMMLLVAAVGAVLLHVVCQFVGPQPLTRVGVFRIRLLELVPLVLAVHIAYHSYPRLRTSFSCLAPLHVRELLVAISAASLASLVGGAYGDIFRFGLLGLAPAAFLWRRKAEEKPQIRRTAAIACAFALGLVGLRTVEHMATHTQHLREAMTHLAAANSHVARLQPAVESAHSTMTEDEVESGYTHHSDAALAAVDSLIALAELKSTSSVVDAGTQTRQAILEHRRSSREMFAQVALSNAAWGDEEAARKAASLAKSAHLETRATDLKCAKSLDALGNQWSVQPAQLEGALTQIRSKLLALAAAIALLGLALWLAQSGTTHGTAHAATVDLEDEPEQAWDSSARPGEPRGADDLMPALDQDLLSVLQFTREEKQEPQNESGWPTP